MLNIDKLKGREGGELNDFEKQDKTRKILL